MHNMVDLRSCNHRSAYFSHTTK